MVVQLESQLHWEYLFFTLLCTWSQSTVPAYQAISAKKSSSQIAVFWFSPSKVFWQEETFELCSLHVTVLEGREQEAQHWVTSDQTLFSCCVALDGALPLLVDHAVAVQRSQGLSQGLHEHKVLFPFEINAINVLDLDMRRILQTLCWTRCFLCSKKGGCGGIFRLRHCCLLS